MDLGASNSLTHVVLLTSLSSSAATQLSSAVPMVQSASSWLATIATRRARSASRLQASDNRRDILQRAGLLLDPSVGWAVVLVCARVFEWVLLCGVNVTSQQPRRNKFAKNASFFLLEKLLRACGVLRSPRNYNGWREKIMHSNGYSGMISRTKTSVELIR